MLPKEENCTGCGACANVCPVDAIKMEYSLAGFLIPVIKDNCIKCGKCEKICPSLHKRKINFDKPYFYSFCADDDIRKISSSGGMFTLLANYTLERSGYVCGAAFDEKLQLSHRIVNTSRELNDLRGSKYLQSDTKDSYKKIKSLVENKEYVLFVGTPCQVAGLYGYLGKDYSTLITADLICAGTASQKFFDNYIKELSKGKKVKNVNFRNKKMGWNCNHVVVEYEDGTEYIGRLVGVKPDPYVNAFKSMMMMRKSCYNCNFATYPRQGDFTIGDLWNWQKLDSKSNDGKGTSFVFINSFKGEYIFEDLKKAAKYVNQIFVEDYSKIPNRIYAKTREHSGRRRFLNLVKRKPFSEAYSYVTSEKYDIGMLGYMCSDNIGSMLTYYALYYALTDLGYEVLPIERPLDSDVPLSPRAVEFFKKWLPVYAQPVQTDSILAMRKYNDVCQKFVVGSDQIFLQGSSNCRKDYCFGQWIDDNKMKVAYATSFGGGGGRGTAKYYDELSFYLNKFHKISCRECDGVEFANNMLRLKEKVELVLDPVFLANRNIYMKLINSVNVERKSEYIGGYVIREKDTIYNLINKAQKAKGCPMVEIIGDVANQVQTEFRGFVHRTNFPVENALEVIYNSKFFVTDSYHGVCFCIILKKDFLVVPRDFHDRFTTLLSRLGLSDRIIKDNHSNLTEKSFAPINWNAVYEKLQIEIGISKHWLKDALEGETHKEFTYTDRDLLMEFIRKQEIRINELQKQVEDLKNS